MAPKQPNREFEGPSGADTGAFQQEPERTGIPPPAMPMRAGLASEGPFSHRPASPRPFPEGPNPWPAFSRELGFCCCPAAYCTHTQKAPVPCADRRHTGASSLIGMRTRPIGLVYIYIRPAIAKAAWPLMGR